MNATCGRFFEEWKADLEQEPGLWMVRCMQTNKWSRNIGWRGFLGGAVPQVVSWEQAAGRLSQADALKLEDTHSRVLKIRGTENRTITVGDEAGDQHKLVASVTADFCDGCPQKCGVVITLLCPVDSTVPA